MLFYPFLFFLVVPKFGAAAEDFFGLTLDKLKETAANFVFSKVSADNIHYLLYQKGSNTPVIITAQNASAILNPAASYKFIFHGWINNGTLPWIKTIAETLHKVGRFNIIAVDWSKDASGSYIQAASACKSVGDHVGDFILSLKVDLGAVHLIGHSLGGQVIGFVGQRLGAGKVGRITGLDPAGPLFEIPIPFIKSLRLTNDDGKFVDVIHTEIFYAGVVLPCGTADFYVNYGKSQPDCLKNDTVACSHGMAHVYYILTIKNPKKYLGTRRGCTSNSCETAYMGYWISKSARDSYSVTANATGINPYTEIKS